MVIPAVNKMVYSHPDIELFMFEEFDCILTGSIDTDELVAPGFDDEDWVG